MNFQTWLEESWRTEGFSIDLATVNDGNLAKWLSVLNDLPLVTNIDADFGDVIRIDARDTLPQPAVDCIEKALQVLIPWRKGPLNLFRHAIDSEWRSDLKWQRMNQHVNWQGKRVLDVGCGNGYFGFRALQSGAIAVLGVDGFLLYAMQAALVNWFVQSANVVVPVRFDDSFRQETFDIVLSLGVYYHQRDPDAHLNALFARCSPAGQIVLESIVADDDFVPEGRYAGMRNVYNVPSVTTLETKLQNVGFIKPRLVDISTTTICEQRTTTYMPYSSLRDALDADDSSLTIEGLPAPRRAIVVATRAA